MTEQQANHKTPLKRDPWITLPTGFAFQIMVLLLGIFLTIIYRIQPDRLVPITMVPAWCWLVVALIGVAIYRGRLLVPVLVVWFLFAAIHVEQLKTIPTQFLPRTDRRPDIRIASLNCNIGNLNAAKEAFATGCDVCLLQESPGNAQLENAIEQEAAIAWNLIWAGDNSIVANGEIRPIHADKTSHFCHVLVTMPDGKRIDVVSLRLSAPVYRFDFWTAGFWSDHYFKRVDHRDQLAKVIKHLEEQHVSETLIIGGDFNSVTNDGAMATTLDEMFDSFGVAGVGWGGTGTNEIPVFRVDQIWASRNLSCSRSSSFKTEHSDHRMVIAGFRFDEQGD